MHIFYLPGSLPPEKEVFQNSRVKTYLRDKYNLDFDSYSATNLLDVDHHNWLGLLANHVNQKDEALMYELAREYAHSLSADQITPLIAQLKAA